MNVDTIIEFLSKTDPNELVNMCKLNKIYAQVCKDHKNTILKRILEKCTPKRPLLLFPQTQTC